MLKFTRPAVVCIALALCAVIAAPAFAQAPSAAQSTRKRKRVAVVDFEVPQTLYGGWGNEGQEAAERLGKVLSDMMITSLVKSGSFDVIERTELEKVLKEHNLNAQGLLDPATAPQASKILGVELILGGKITEFGVKEKRGGGLGVLAGGLLGVDLKKSTARAVIDARLIDTTTAKILLAEQGTGENAESSISFGGTDFAHFLAVVNFESSEWVDSRIGRATRDAVNEVIGKMTALFPVEASVLGALPDGSVILDLGKFNGVQVGDQFDVMRIELLKDEQTGEVIYEDRKPLGTIKVVEVQDSRCKCAGTLTAPAQKGDMAILKKAPTAEPKKDSKKGK